MLLATDKPTPPGSGPGSSAASPISPASEQSADGSNAQGSNELLNPASSESTPAGKTAEPAQNRNTELMSPLETSVVDLFVQLSRVLGQPRSLAEIYGLLFISTRPLAMDDLIARLHLSKGSASQGLKYLRNLGAIREVYVPGERRVHYEAVAELRNLVTRFLRDQVVPQLEAGEDKLDRIAAMTRKLPAADRAHVARRVTMLQSWGKNARRAASLVAKVISV